MNQLFYNIAGGIEHQIGHQKQTAISEVIVRGKLNIKQNRNWFYFKFSVESSSFIFNNFKTEILSLPLKVKTDQFVNCLVLLECLSVKISCISPSDCEANCDSADADSTFPLFFSFSVSFKNSSPREKVGKLSLFWDWWAEFLFVSIIVAKRSDVLMLLACTFGILSTLTYTEFDCVALLAML